MRKTLWLSGRNYVTSFPRDWVEEIKKYSGLNVEQIRINNKIIITPLYDPHRKEKVKLILGSPPDFDEFITKLISAYLHGYDRLRINIPLTDEIKNNLYKILPGINIEILPNGVYEIIFSPAYEISLDKSLQDLEEIFNVFYEKTIESFEKVSDSSIIEQNKKFISELEKKTDRITFQVRRYLAKSFLYAELFEKLGLKDEMDTLYITNIYGYYERMADLHREIHERLEKISKLKVPINLESFSKYYSYAYDIVQVSFRSFNDPEKGLEIIKSKRRGWESYKNGALVESVKEIKKTIRDILEIENVDEDTKIKIVRYLVILEGKLRAIPDTSSNICELNYNRNIKNFIENY